MKLWDGRFKKPAAGLMDTFNNSLPFDKALIERTSPAALPGRKRSEGKAS